MYARIVMVRGFAALVTVALLAPVSASAAPTLGLTLDGKVVERVPVDRLGDVKLAVSAGTSSFKALYAGQWSGIDQTCSVAATGFVKGTTPPSYAGGWDRYSLARTGDDSGWSAKSRLDTTLAAAGKMDGLALFHPTTEQQVVFTAVFRREVYTGNQIWIDGQFVKEKAWEQAGPAQGQAVLALDPPTFADTLDQTSHLGAAVVDANAPPHGDYIDIRAVQMAKAILYPTAFGGRKVDFAGSKVVEFSAIPGANAVFNWNYADSDDSQRVQARYPVKVRVQAAMSTRFDGLDTPVDAADAFTCDASLVIDRRLGSGGSWVLNGVEIGSDFADSCKTDDGRSAAAVAATVKHPAEGLKELDLNDSRSEEDRAADILRSLGIPAQ